MEHPHGNGWGAPAGWGKISAKEAGGEFRLGILAGSATLSVQAATSDDCKRA
jgi:hypothetical protein